MSEEPGPAVGDDPAAAAAAASGGEAPDDGFGGGDPADAMANAEESGSGLMAALFETDPDMDASEVDAPEWAGEFLVGTRKLLHGLGLDTGDGGDGTPAVVNFARGVWGLVSARSEHAEDAERGAAEEAEDGVEVVA